jgi:hypothetical protein
MVRVYVPFGGAGESRHVLREEGTMKRIAMWLMVAALMAALMAATAVPAFTDVGKRQALCGEVAIPGFVTANPGDYGPATSDNARDGSSIGKEIRGNASACNAGEGPPV